MFNINYSAQCLKFLKKSEKIVVKRILKKIEELRKDPITHDSKTVASSKEKLFRIRVGDYRILYEVDYKGNLIGIVTIDKREKAY